MYFATNRAGLEGCDQFVFIVPNGLAVIGLAPSHALIRAHREATGHQPLQLQYVPPAGLDIDALPSLDDEDGMPQAPLTAQDGDVADGSTEPQSMQAEAAQDDTSGQQDAQALQRGSAEAGPSRTTKPCPTFSADELAKVNFGRGRQDHSQTKLSGSKRKNQGTWLHPGEVICHIESSTGSRCAVGPLGRNAAPSHACTHTHGTAAAFFTVCSALRTFAANTFWDQLTGRLTDACWLTASSPCSM